MARLDTLAKKRMTSAISSGISKRGSHWTSLTHFFAFGVTYSLNCLSVITQPGDTVLTLIPRGPTSLAKALVNPDMAPFEAT